MKFTESTHRLAQTFLTYLIPISEEKYNATSTTTSSHWT